MNMFKTQKTLKQQHPLHVGEEEVVTFLNSSNIFPQYFQHTIVLFDL